jgi:hypothetical protein
LNRPRLSTAEVIAASVTCWLALAAVAGYLVDAAGLGVQPWAALALALVLTGGAVTLAPIERDRNLTDTIAWLGIVAFILAILLRMSPSLVPPGRGPDLTHHLLLVDYIEHTRHLVHDRSLGGAMGEMAHYTPASHLLAVMAGAWFGADGLRAFFPLVAFCAALTAGFVFLIARRAGLSLPIAVAAVALLFLPSQYFFGAFTHDGFLAQTVSTLFAVAMWWAIAAWDERPSTGGAVMVAMFLAAVFLSWPIWLGPPLLLFLSLVLWRDLALSERLRQLAIVVAPLLVIALMHSWQRWGWMVIVRTSGAVLHPSIESLGVILPLLAIAGVIVGVADRRVRVSVVLLFVIALQALTLFIIARAQGADTPYMAFKMMYLAIYPLAILAALALSRLGRGSKGHEAIGWLLASILLVIAVRPAIGAPRTVPVIDLNLYAAGRWVRANGGASCADYLVADAQTAYWLHLAVLGNPRASERMREVDRYEPRAAIGPWITATGRRYAIADLRLLPDEVRSRVTVVAQFGSAAVLTRPDAIIVGCD